MIEIIIYVVLAILGIIAFAVIISPWIMFLSKKYLDWCDVKMSKYL